MSERMMDKINNTVDQRLESIEEVILDAVAELNETYKENNIHLSLIADSLKIIASQKEEPKAKTIKKKN